LEEAKLALEDAHVVVVHSDDDAGDDADAGSAERGEAEEVTRAVVEALLDGGEILLAQGLDADEEPAAARRGGGAPDRFEAEDLKFHQDLRDAYKQIAAEDPQRCVLIDASGDPDAVAALVWTALRDHLFAMASPAPSA
jgi:dTMP kinase